MVGYGMVGYGMGELGMAWHGGTGMGHTKGLDG